MQLAAQQSRQEILQATLSDKWLLSLFEASQQLPSPTLILRPSLSVPRTVNSSLSGLFTSQVCWCESQTLELAIKQAWAELFNAKNIFYWQRIGIGIEQINLAILVQPISNAIVLVRQKSNLTPCKFSQLGVWDIAFCEERWHPIPIKFDFQPEK